MTSFFRQQALDVADSRLGSASSTRQISTWLLIFLLSALLIVAGIFLFTTQYSRKVEAIGSLTPAMGSFRIVGDRNGIVTDLLVRNGDKVSRGQRLLAISASPTINTGATVGDLLKESTEKQLAALSDDLASETAAEGVEKELFRIREDALGSEIESSADILTLQLKRLDNAQSNLRSARQLQSEKLISEVELRTIEEKVLDLKQNAESLKATIARLKSEQAKTRLDRSAAALKSRSDRARIVATIGTTEERNIAAAATAKVIINSPIDGVVSGLRSIQGEQVVSGVALATIIPKHGTMLAELWVPSTAIGFIKKGGDVNLMYSAFPYQKFGVAKGKITDVSASPTDLSELPSQFRNQESLYRVLVEPEKQFIEAYGQRHELTSGMKLTGDFVLDKKPLIEWILEPLLATKERLRN